MTELLVLLSPISLADSLSVVPMCIVPLAVLLAGRQPLVGSTMFLAGVVIPYYAFGVLIALGLDRVFGQLEQLLKRSRAHSSSSFNCSSELFFSSSD